MSKSPNRLLFLCKAVALLTIVLICSGTTHAQSSSADATQFSDANQILFFQDHLHKVVPPASLIYSFEKESDFDGDESFSDTLIVNILPGTVGTKNAVVDYFSGVRNRTVPEFTDVTGNPLLTLALQRDIYHMDRLLDGGVGWRHFQKMIKIAFEESANITEREITYQGTSFKARDIVIRPFESDPLARRFPAFRNKIYTITVAEQIPGMIFQISTVVEPDVGTNVPANAIEEPARSGSRITEHFVLTDS